MGQAYKAKDIRLDPRSGTSSGYRDAARLTTSQFMNHLQGMPVFILFSLPFFQKASQPRHGLIHVFR